MTMCHSAHILLKLAAVPIILRRHDGSFNQNTENFIRNNKWAGYAALFQLIATGKYSR